MRVTFQYFEGCPNASDTLRHLKELVKEHKIAEDELEVQEVSDLDSAEKTRFQGSPTILIEGVDIYTMKKPVGVNYACRIYDFEGKRTGIISKRTIEMKLGEWRRKIA